MPSMSREQPARNRWHIEIFWEIRRKVQKSAGVDCAIGGRTGTFCKDRAGRALLSDCSTNERSAFIAVPLSFLGDEARIGGSAIGCWPCWGGSVAGGHHHAPSCWRWALPGRCVAGGHEKSWRACALATLSCPPRSLSFFSLELYATACTAALHHREPQTGFSGRDSLPWICLLFSISRPTTLVLERITRMPVDHVRHPCQRAAPMLRGVGRASIRLTLHCDSQRVPSGESTIGWENTLPVCRGSPWRLHVALNRRF